MKHVPLALMAATLLAGCAAAYKPPTSGETATISFLAPAAQMFGLSQTTTIVTDEQCANPALLASFTPLKAERVLRQIVPAESRLYLRAGMNSSLSFPLLRYCTSLVSFVPRSGATYTLKQSFSGESCAVQLLQESDLQTPQSFQVHAAKPCR